MVASLALTGGGSTPGGRGLVGLVLLAGFGLGSLAASAWPAIAWMVRAMAYAALISPALLFAEFSRRWLYQARMPATAALSSVAYAVGGVAIACLSLRFKTGWVGAAAWAGAGSAAFLVSVICLPPGRAHWREGWRRWWAHRHFAAWQSACHMPFAVYNSAVVILVGVFGGPVAAATFTATRTLTNPANSVVTAVDQLDKPRAARALLSHGLPGLRSSVARTRRLLALVTGLYLGLIAVFAGPVMRLAFGDRYDGHVTDVRILAATFFLIGLNQPSETFLIVLRDSRLMLAIRMITAGAAALGLWWGSRVAGVTGCAVALFLLQLLNLANLRIAEIVAGRRWRPVIKGDAIAAAAAA